MSYKTVIFDLDGTLLNTLEDLCDSVNVMLQHYNFPLISLKQARQYLGNGAKNLIKRSLPFDISEQETEPYLNIFRNHYDNNIIMKTKPYDGIIEVLKILKDNSIKIAIVSNKYYKAVENLNKIFFKEYIDVSIGERVGINKKPASDMVFLALFELYKKDIFDFLIQKNDLKCINFLLKFKSDMKYVKNNDKDVVISSYRDADEEEITDEDYKNLISVMTDLLKNGFINLNECLYIGDSEVDIDTAKNSGLKCVSVSWGFRDREKLQALNEFIVIDKPSDLISIVLN